MADGVTLHEDPVVRDELALGAEKSLQRQTGHFANGIRAQARPTVEERDMLRLDARLGKEAFDRADFGKPGWKRALGKHGHGGSTCNRGTFPSTVNQGAGFAARLPAMAQLFSRGLDSWIR